MVFFNPKCLDNGIPWQLKYLNKRLKVINKFKHLFITDLGGLTC